ncbi:Cell division protein FtsI/penicillin-binding protein 2 [Gaiella occulta]|uniref:Cell division protein FtsI/penicillin-binding protein 2 n=1 Tax=Gaiella occulta TaxID=1002870 RepID=A0A7M2YZP9_9ACTN|nr:penicillin-binding protein 2 [Gaiella occulta]RDI74991.1 Cell division protein FtsI/penicillin-binding protein 2 [Gaiella occulta]
MSERIANRRIRLLVVCFALVFAVSLGRAVWVQALQHDRLAAMASTQRRETIEIPAGRGTIYDRTGEPLAIGEQATTVYADPRNIADAQKAASVVGRTLGLDPSKLYQSLKDRSKGFVYVQRKADPAKAEALTKRDIPGLGFYPEELRAYPQGTVAAHVLGFAGTDNRGLDGLERALDKTLSGRAGSETIVKDPFGRAIDVVTSRPERAGRNVTLTIDHQIQANAEQVLAATVKRFKARGAAAIVMDPRTGAILAMANYPTFDANAFGKASPEARRNRAVTDAYEPGSTFKIVTIAAALEDNVVTPASKFTLAPTIRVADRVIHEAESRGTERMTVKEILSKSSNVGTITIAQLLGAGELSSWIDRFGFGKPTGIDYPGESRGLVLPLEQWSGSTIGTVPIGQGIAVTPLQMVSAYATIGNGGVRRTPYLVEKVGSRKARVPAGRRVVSTATAQRMMAMFRGVVVEGTGTEAAVPGYTVAGKTGTAQKAERGRYVRKYVASFVGLVPAKKPRLAILVMVDEPRGNIYGGVVAAPAFRDIARFDLQYLEVLPDAPETKPALTAAAGPPNQ